MQCGVHLASALAGYKDDLLDQRADGLGGFLPVLGMVQGFRQPLDLVLEDACDIGMDIRQVLRLGGEQGDQFILPSLHFAHALDHAARIAAILDHLEHLFQPLAQFGQFRLPAGRAGAALMVGAVRFLDIGAHGLRCRFGRHQPVLETRQHAVFQFRATDRGPVGAGAVVHVGGAGESVAAPDRAGTAAYPTEHQPRQERFWTALAIELVDRGADAGTDVHALLRDQRLPVAHRLPEIVIHDPQFGNVGDDPLRLRVQPRDALAGLRVFQIAQPVPDEASDIKLIVEDAGATQGIAPQGGVVPLAAGRAGDAFVVQAAGDGKRAASKRKLTEDAADDFGLNGVDLALAPDQLAPRVHLMHDAIAVAQPAAGFTRLDPAPQAAMGFQGQILEEQGVHRALEADVKLGDLALGQGDDGHAGELQALEQGGDIGLVAGHAIEGFGQYKIELPGLGVA